MRDGLVERVVPIKHESLRSDIAGLLSIRGLRNRKLFVSTATSYKLFLALFASRIFSLRGIVLMLHNFDLGANRVSVFETGGLFALLLRWFLKRISKVIVVNREMAERLAAHGVRNVLVAPAYVRTESTEPLPAEVAGFIAGYRRVVCSNGWIKLIPEGELYGIREMAESASALPAGTCFVIYVINVDKQGIEERAYYGELKRLAAGNPNLMLYESKVAFDPLLRHSEAFVRNTLSDGDALSIREAIDHGVKVLATDVVVRPRGVLTYRPGELSAAIAGIDGHAFDYPEKIDSYRAILDAIV
jgi:hypothetical protein